MFILAVPTPKASQPLDLHQSLKASPVHTQYWEMYISAIYVQCLPRSTAIVHIFSSKAMHMCVCFCLSLVCTGASTIVYVPRVQYWRSRSRACWIGWEGQCKSFAVAALRERLILLSPSLCARELFCVGKRKRRKRHSKDGEVARQTKEAFQRTFPSLYHRKRGKAGLEGGAVRSQSIRGK